MKKFLLLIALACLGLIQSINAQSQLWSTTFAGGIDGAGAIIRINPDGSNFNTAYSFPATSLNGATPV